MPLTASHPAAVLPLRRLGLPMAALVAGSMVPDLPLFVRSEGGYAATHTIWGAVTVDVVLAGVALVLWFVLVRDALVDLSPDLVRSRLAPHVSLSLRRWLLCVPAAAVGALSHVVWDDFTHAGRWGVEHVAWLRLDHGGLPGHRWAQYLSGVVGLLVVCWAAYTELRRRPGRPQQTSRPRWASALLVAGGSVVVGTAAASACGHRSSGLHALAFHTVVSAILATLVSVVAVALVWRALHERASSPSR